VVSDKPESDSSPAPSVESTTVPSDKKDTRAAEAAAVAVPNTYGEFLKSCLNLTNVLIFVYMFCAASFNYYLITFYTKYMPGNVYVNTIVSSVAEMVAAFLAGSL